MNYQELIMLKGLPGSGKSTWAKQYIKENPLFKRINKDDIRAMIQEGWSVSKEKQVIAARNALVKTFLHNKMSVIVDDTNLSPKHETELHKIALENEVPFVVKFFDVSVDECIRRDSRRDNPVGYKVIRDMYRKYLVKDKVVYDKSLPRSIICDLDGTLALMRNRDPYEVDKYHTDFLNVPIAGIVDRYVADGYHVIFLSGRSEDQRLETVAWLESFGYLGNNGHQHLYMRKSKDNRNDSLVKRELFDEHIRDKYSITFVLDDRDRVVNMWRDLGLTVLQVADGDF